jgi:hypothetical protein
VAGEEERRMSRPPLKIDAQLEASLRRVSGALEHSRAVMTDRLAAAAEDLDRVATKTDAATARIVERHERRMEGMRRRHERRRERLRRAGASDEADIPKGIVFAVVAIVCLLFALIRPQFFWMVFVALGFGMSAAQLFGRAATRRRRERDGQSQAGSEAIGEAESRDSIVAAEVPPAPPAPPAPVAEEPADPKVARIQGLCDKLLAELESGPPIVREVVTEPEATIAGLRKACLETARRERELRAVLAGQHEAELVAERDALAARIGNERDEIVRERLGQALAALEQQLVHRAALATAATRLEAENTRILYTLENVHMQLLRARSTDIGAPELGGKLRDSLRELGTQIEAVAEALELADAPVPSTAAASRVPVPEPGGVAGTGPGSPDAERAERAAAARRAAQAQRR